MAYQEKQLLASAARTVSGQTEEISSMSVGAGIDHFSSVSMYLNVTAASGSSPTLDVVIESRLEGVWYVENSFAQKITTGQEKIDIGGMPCDIRVSWTIGGGSPSFTFQVDMARS